MWPPKHIKYAGVELEGGFDTPERPAGYHHDGSVTVRMPFVGENVSPPLKPVDLLAWVDSDGNYPAFINSSCGMHVHLSTKDVNDYALLMEGEFWEAFLVEMERWGKAANVKNTDFWKRLQGTNNFCKRNFKPNEQWRSARKGDADRYTQLNFCYTLHGTLECRLLPMFKSRGLAVAAIKNYLKFTDDYIAKARKGFNKRVEAEERIDERTIVLGREEYGERHPIPASLVGIVRGLTARPTWVTEETRLDADALLRRYVYSNVPNDDEDYRDDEEG